MNRVPRLLNKIQIFYCLPLREQLWFIVLYPYSGVVRAAILILPFRLLCLGFGRYHQNIQLSPLANEKQQQLAWRIGRICEVTAKYTPWQSRCFVQAIMAQTLLNLYGIPYVMHLGALISGRPEKPIAAHAWVKVGPWVITGGQGYKAYNVLSSFVAPRLLN